MSANPRIVLADTWVGPATKFQPGSYFARRGTLIDAAPGSATEAAYGGPSNLGAVAPTGDPAGADHAALAN
jgi:hypothetical protein